MPAIFSYSAARMPNASSTGVSAVLEAMRQPRIGVGEVVKLFDKRVDVARRIPTVIAVLFNRMVDGHARQGVQLKFVAALLCLYIKLLIC